MSILNKIKPKFWDHHVIVAGPKKALFSFRRKWKLMVIATSVITLTPLVIITLVEYNLTRRTFESDIRSQTFRLVSNTARGISLFLSDHRSAQAHQDRKRLDDNPTGLQIAERDSEVLDKYLTRLEIDSQADLFIVNRQGILQTSSRFHGDMHAKVSLPLPAEVNTIGVFVFDTKNKNNEPIVLGYAHIPDTSFILMAVQPKTNLMQPWFAARLKLVGILIISIFTILLAIVGMATFLVNRIHTADQRRVEASHQAEHANRLASIGRLAAGVAHEINNPLAIINEKVGLIKDLFTLRQQYSQDPRLIDLIDSVIASVRRCGAITRRLLNFARHMEVSIKSIDLPDLIRELVDFHAKEAEYRCIGIFMEISDDLPRIESDQGNLQQIFLNLLNNAFAAMNDGGRLDIKVQRVSEDFLEVSFTDNGCGIAEEDLKRIFEPFFSTKTQENHTGLGLSITYGLVQEIGGQIRVKSEVGQGSCFTVALPLTSRGKAKKNVCELK